MTRRHLLPLAIAVLATLLAACHVVEPQDAELEHPEGCALVAPGMMPNPTTPRFHHYRTNIDMGDALPTTVSTRGGGATRTWVGRANRTARIDSGLTGLSFLLVPNIAGLIIGGFMLFIFVIVAFQKEDTPGRTGPNRTPAEQRRFLVRYAAITFAILLAAGLSGYFAGSVVSIDNPTAVPVQVTLDGEVITLNANSFIDQRVWGSNIDIDIRANGQLVESATLHLDDGPGDALRRALIGNGRFVYAVCGLNSYSLQTAHYGRR